MIEGGKIAEVGARRDRDDAIVIDLGDVTVLPGFVDVYSGVPEGNARQIGLRLLSFGITTIVAEGRPEIRAEDWESEQSPGPRLLRAASLEGAVPGTDPVPWSLITIPESSAGSFDDQRTVQRWQALGVPVLAESFSIGRRIGADLSLGSAALPESPLGRRYQDLRLTAGGGPVTRVSGLADAATPGIARLLQSRQARALGEQVEPARRFSEPPPLYGAATSVVVGSKPNGLPPGIALHAELRALAAAGLSGAETLQAAGANAAGVLGLRGQLGRIAPGALADLLLVNGDPLENVEDTLDIAAVVRNGRFYSLVRLLEEAEAAGSVE